MSRRACLGFLAALSVGAGAAACGGAAAMEEPAGSPADLPRALALIDYGPEAAGFQLKVAPPRAGMRAQADRTTRTVTVFLRRHDMSHRVAHDIAHEVGHAYDFDRMTPGERRAYLRRRGVPRAPWWPRGSSDYGSGAGDFAEVFALCHAASPEFRSRLAPRPAAPCALLPDAARRAPRTSGPG